MNCTHVQQNLKAFHDGELGRVTRASVALHLARCRACRAELEAITTMSQEIRSLGVPEQSDDVREAVLAAARGGPSPVRTVGRRVRRVLLAAGGAGAVIAVALLLMLRPTTAQAALDRVIAAAEAVKTCHEEWRLGQPGAPQTEHRLWYDQGKFRMEEWRSGKLEEAQVFHDAQLETYVASTNQVLRAAADQPFATKFEGFTVAATIRAGMSSADVKCESVRDAEGRELNRFTITQEQMQRMVILADPASDLPVSIEFYGPLDGGWEKVGESTVIEYNTALDPGLFVLNPPEGATVVDLDTVKAEWQQHFDAGIARVTDGDQEAVLRDFQVTTEGDVFAIWTAGFPSAIHNASLQDDLGTTYLQDTQGHGYFQAKSWPCAWFIPLAPPARQPAWYSLRVTNGHHTYTFRMDKPVFSGSADPVYPNLEEKRGEASFLYPGGVEGEMARPEIRAEYWKDKGDARQALRYYEEELAVSEREYGAPSAYTNTWLDIGLLYEQVGQRAKAHDAYQHGLEFHRRDVNRNNPDQVEVAEKLEQGLARTQ